jgi:hypothetical protein
LHVYAGGWVVKSEEKNMAVLSLDVHHHKLVGTISMPRFTENYLGKFSDFSLPISTYPVSGHLIGKSVKLTVGLKPARSVSLMKLIDQDHTSVAWFQGIVPDLKFERVPHGQEARVSTDWPMGTKPPE